MGDNSCLDTAEVPEFIEQDVVCPFCGGEILGITAEGNCTDFVCICGERWNVVDEGSDRR